MPNARSSMLSLQNKVPPPVVGAAVAAAMWAVSAVGPQFSLASVPKYALVASLAVAGVTFDALGILAFRRARTTINPLKPQRASSMVTGGVYRVTRNPMYLGMALLLLAWAVYLSALLPFAGPVILVAYITQFQIKPEERVAPGHLWRRLRKLCRPRQAVAVMRQAKDCADSIASLVHGARLTAQVGLGYPANRLQCVVRSRSLLLMLGAAPRGPCQRLCGFDQPDETAAGHAHIGRPPIGPDDAHDAAEVCGDAGPHHHRKIPRPASWRHFSTSLPGPPVGPPDKCSCNIAAFSILAPFTAFQDFSVRRKTAAKRGEPCQVG